MRLNLLPLFPELKVLGKAVQFSLARCLEHLAPHHREEPGLSAVAVHAHAKSVYAAVCLNVHLSMFCASSWDQLDIKRIFIKNEHLKTYFS